MDFSYKKVPIINIRTRTVVDYVYRPLIRLGIQQKDKSYLDCEALIDSGSDDSIFPAEVAKRAGIRVVKENDRVFRGLGDGTAVGYGTQVRLLLGGHSFSTIVYFSYDFVGYGILGQRGFFDTFRVRFIYNKKRIEIVEERK